MLMSMRSDFLGELQKDEPLFKVHRKIDVPPLRERREDISLLFEHFLLQASARHGRPEPTATPGRLRDGHALTPDQALARFG